MTLIIRQFKNSVKCLMISCVFGFFSVATHASYSAKLTPIFYFFYQSSSLSRKSVDVLEALKCNVGKDPLERLFVIGHASKDERNPHKLAKERADQIKKWLVNEAGWDEKVIFTEGKAASQPISDDPVKNQRVETETVGWKPTMDASSNKSCGPLR